MGLVSVIMASYNAANTIIASVESIIAQTYTNWELIIVNDGSTDETIEIVERYTMNESRIVLINFSTNKGVSTARNIGLKSAKGAFIAFCDADDIWLPSKLEIQLPLLSKYAIVCSNYLQFNETTKKTIIFSKIIDLNKMLYSNRIPNSSAIINRNYIFDVEFRNVGHEDYFFWLEIFQKTPHIVAFRCQEILLHYRLGQSLSSNKIKAVRWQWNIYRKLLGFTLIRSLYLFSFYAFINITKHFIVLHEKN
jgi:glycosyltransferase involved in cell wall biosynthesis